MFTFTLPVFSEKILQKRFFCSRGKTICIPKTSQDQVGNRFLLGKPCPQPFLALKLGSQLQTLGKVGWPRLSAAGPGWRAAPGSGGGWELYSMRQGTPRVGSQKCQGEISRWYHWNIKNEALVFLDWTRFFCVFLFKVYGVELEGEVKRSPKKRR